MLTVEMVIAIEVGETESCCHVCTYSSSRGVSDRNYREESKGTKHVPSPTYLYGL
jgi:hypothetical protein